MAGNNSVESRFVILCVLLLAVLGGCTSQEKPKGSPTAATPRSGPDSLAWDSDTAAPGAAARTPSGAKRQDNSASALAAPQGTWGVVLATFTGDGHRQTAESFRVDIARRFPEVAAAYVVPRTDGSAVLVGHFAGPTDSAARSTLQQVKAISDGRQQAFPRAMLSRTESSAAPMGRFDLRQVRRRFDGPGELYTVQVAVWGDFGSSQMSLATIQARAEQHTNELRQRGLPAFYHHDDDRKLSIVTVGIFDSKAYDPRSTLYSPEVEATMTQFPVHLMNGEELLLQTDPNKPGHMEPQRCRLVEIPK